MTLQEFFDSKPHGTIKDCVQKTGFSTSHVRHVMKGSRTCSPFFAKCIEEYAGVKLDFKKGQVNSKSKKTC